MCRWVLAFLGAACLGHPALGGSLEADRVTLSPVGVWAQGHVDLSLDGHQITADTISLVPKADGRMRFEATHFSWTPCVCERPPWGISGEGAEGVFGEYLVIENAAVQVCGVPVFPLPFSRISLDPRSPRLLLPELRYGDDGPVLGVPVWLPLGERSAMILTPELWGEKGVRQRVFVDGPLGFAKVWVAKQDVYAAPTSALDTQISQDVEKFWGGADIQWSSDSGARRDYSGDFFERSRMFEERRMVVGAGPLRLESDTFDTADVQRPVGGVLSVVGLPLGPLSVGAVARLDALEYSQSQPVENGSSHRSSVIFNLDGGRQFGFVDTEYGLDITGLQTSRRAPYGQATAEAAALIAGWADVGKLRHIGQTGLAVRVSADDGELDDPMGWVKPRAPWAVGAVQRSTLLGVSGVPLHWSAEWMRTPSGWAPEASLVLNHKGIVSAVQGDLVLQSALVGFTDEGGDVRVGAVRGAGLFQGMASASVLVAPGWRPGWSGLLDFQTSRFLRQGPQLLWDSQCDCLRVRMGLEWANDRHKPDAMIQIDLQPRRAKDTTGL